MKPVKKTELYIKIFSLAVFAVLLIAASEDFYRFRVCFGAGKRIPSFTDAVPVRFLLYGSSGDTVSAAFYLFDSAHKELAAVERSWKGDSLAVEFAGAPHSKHVYLSLSACTPGKMYVIKTDSQGGLEVRAE